MKGCFDGCVVLRECVISIVIPGDIAEYYHISHISPPAAQMVSHLHPDSSPYHPHCIVGVWFKQPLIFDRLLLPVLRKRKQ